MADVSIKYKGVEKASLNASGSKTIKTSGKYCEDDIIVEYTDPEKPEQSKIVTPTAAGFTVTPDNGKVLSSVIVNGDTDLVSANVRSGKNIFGVEGSLVEGIIPSGTAIITANGTHDVAEFASANVDVAQNSHAVTFNQPVATPSGGITLVSADQIFKAHRSDPNAVLTLTRLDEGYKAQAANFVMVTNKPFIRGDGNYTAYGAYQGYTSASATASNFANDLVSVPLTGGTTSGFKLYIDENGNLYANCISNRRVSGNYRAVLTW